MGRAYHGNAFAGRANHAWTADNAAAKGLGSSGAGAKGGGKDASIGTPSPASPAAASGPSTGARSRVAGVAKAMGVAPGTSRRAPGPDGAASASSAVATPWRRASSAMRGESVSKAETWPPLDVPYQIASDMTFDADVALSAARVRPGQVARYGAEMETGGTVAPLLMGELRAAIERDPEVRAILNPEQIAEAFSLDRQLRNVDKIFARVFEKE